VRKPKRKFEVVMRVTQFFDDGDYQVVDSKELRKEVTCTDSSFSTIYAGGFIEDLVKFFDTHGVDGLKSLCEAIESLGQGDENGEASVWMGPLYDPACEHTRPNGSC
jgi:hypothetical protein